jgi:hypothetical protein
MGLDWKIKNGLHIFYMYLKYNKKKGYYFKMFLLLLFFSYVTSVTILVLPASETQFVGTFDCFGSYTLPPYNGGTCASTIYAAVVYGSSHPGTLIQVIGSSYTLNDFNVPTGDTFIPFTGQSITLEPFYDTTPFVTVTFSSLFGRFLYGIVIDADFIRIQSMSFTNDDSMRNVILIENSDAPPEKRTEFFHEPDWEFLSFNNESLQSKRDGFEMGFEIAEGLCLDCFCGCGVTPLPAFIRNGITITNVTLVGVGTDPILVINGTFGLNNTIIKYNSFISSDPTIIDIYINTNYIDSTDLTLNYYGTCKYPNVVITFCQDTAIYLPYFTDPNFLYPGPIAVQFVNGTTIWYSSLQNAYNGGISTGSRNVTTIVRGELPITIIFIANLGIVTITPTPIFSCCAFLNIVANLNPALYSIFPSIYLRDIRVIMGTNSGLLLYRGGVPVISSYFTLFNASIYSPLISAATLLPTNEVTRLTQSISPAIPPIGSTFDPSLLRNVNIKSETGTYMYAVLAFFINQNLLFNNIVIENCMIENALIGIASSGVTINVLDNFFDDVQNAIAIQSFTSSVNFNKFLDRNSAETLVLLANTNSIAFTNNIIIYFESIVAPTYPVLSNYTATYNALIAYSTDYYQEFDNITINTTPIEVLMGPDSDNYQIFITEPFGTYIRNCSYDLKLFYVPAADWNPIYFGTFSVYVFSGLLDNFTVATIRQDLNLDSLPCPYFVLYSLYGFMGNLETAPTFSLNDPHINTPDAIFCSSAGLSYEAEFNQFNENYYLKNIPPVTTGIATTGIATTAIVTTSIVTTSTTTISTTTTSNSTSNSTTTTVSSTTSQPTNERGLALPLWMIVFIMIVLLVLLFGLVVLCFLCSVDPRRKNRRRPYAGPTRLLAPSTEATFAQEKKQSRQEDTIQLLPHKKIKRIKKP